MAPRKKPNNEQTTTSETTPRVRKQATKPKLKTPTLIQVKALPQKPAEKQMHATRSLMKSLNLARKIELANEVAELQLKKPSIVVSIKNDNIKNEVIDNSAVPSTVKRGRSKKAGKSSDHSSDTNDKTSETNGETSHINGSTSETPSVNRKTKITNRKSTIVNRKTSIDGKSMIITRKISIDGKTKISKKKVSIDGKIVKQKTSTDAKKVIRRKPSIDSITTGKRKVQTANRKPNKQPDNTTNSTTVKNQKEQTTIEKENTSTINNAKKEPVINSKTPKRVRSNNVVEKTPGPRKKADTNQTAKRTVKKKPDTTSKPRVNNITQYLTITKKTKEGKEISKDNTIDQNHSAKATTVETRKVSVASSTNLSWTKDLSSSNTSISASSNDFVRIDNKLPILRLTKVDSIKQEKIDNNDSSESSESEHQTCVDVIDDLNLSTSSITTVNSKNVKNNVKDELRKAFDKLSSSLKKFDLEIMKWIGHNNDDTVISFQNKILNVLKEESDVLDNCRRLKNYLKGTDTQENIGHSSKNKDEVDFVRPADVSRKIRDDSNGDDVFLTSESRDCVLSQNVGTPLPQKSNDENVRTSTRVSIDGHNYEDDDALSLYAESITGIESSRLNISVPLPKRPAVYDEYIPQPVSEKPVEKFTYKPTKITDEQEASKKTICEKQKADSTVDKEYYDILVDTVMATFETDYQDGAKDFDDRTPEAPTCSLEKPNGLLSLNQKSLNRFTNIFRNICYNNLVGNCKAINNCRYKHTAPDIHDVSRKLSLMREEDFIREYMYVREYIHLRRKYGFCFVEVAQNKKLTRILLEMAIDFTAKATIGTTEDSNLQLLVLETVLMYLNKVRLEEFKDLLQHRIAPFITLCDVFMVTIAMTQNFSRFKLVFLNLCRFMVENNRSFSKKVAIQVLERVCILPHEEPLSRAVIDILKRTDASVFQTKMADQFERQLGVYCKELQDEYVAAKTLALLRQPLLSKDSDSLAVNVTRSDDYTSPDTTNVDTMLKNLESAKPSPTDSNAPRFSQFSSPNSSVADWPKYQNWWRPQRPMQTSYFRPIRPRGRAPRRKVMYHPAPRTHPSVCIYYELEFRMAAILYFYQVVIDNEWYFTFLANIKCVLDYNRTMFYWVIMSSSTNK